MEENNKNESAVLTPEQEIETIRHENQELKNVLKETVDALSATQESNIKLAWSTRLFCEAYFTKQEKITIAEEIDHAKTADQVEKIYNKHIANIMPADSDVNSEFLWSRGFTRELQKYYLQYRGYNPFDNIEESVAVIREHFKIEESLKSAQDNKQVESLQAKWLESWDLSQVAMNNIIAVANQANGK